jgi:hypothetical protein
MQFPGQGKPPVGIIFDCDMGRRIDDALALALLYGFDGKNEVRVVSLSVSYPNLKAAALCEVIGRFYAGAVSGAFASVGRTLPVGLAAASPMAPDTAMLTGPLSKTTDKGEPVYAHGIQRMIDTAEVPALIRNAFTSQYDDNCIVVLAGPATNLAGVLRLPGVKELIARKVRFLSMTLDAKADVAAARKLLAEWPAPVVACGPEIGEAILFPAESIEKDFAWSPAHPVVDAYRAYKTMPYDAPTGAMAAVLHAARAKENYFKLSEPGTLEVGDDGSMRLKPSADGKHRSLILDAAQKDRVLQTYREVASAKPVPRQPRFRRPVQPVKPEEKKQ